MAGFDLFTFLTKFLGGLDIPGVETKVTTWLKEKGSEYPDLAARTDALAEYLKTVIAEAAPELEPGAIAATVKGIAEDIVHGTAGVDPGAWLGGA